MIDSGIYEPDTRKRVTHWPLPDANGDGEEVWEDQRDGSGNMIGRRMKTDEQGRPIRHYSAPAGFANFPTQEPGSDNQRDNYVKVDKAGRVWRHPRTGEAVGIAPGKTLVEYANGDFEHLHDDYSRYLFAQAHRKTDAGDMPEVEAPKTDAQKRAEVEAKDREEFEAWKRNRDKDSGEGSE